MPTLRAFALALLFLLPATMATAASDGPERFVETLTANALAALKRGDVPSTERQMAFERLVNDGFDLSAISGYVLGQHWKKASESEQSAFRDAFSDYLVLTYAQRVGSAPDARIRVVGSAPAGQFWRVGSAVQDQDGRDHRIDWLVRQAGQDWRVVDVLVDGISMATTYRDQFAAVIRINGGNIAALTAKLQEKNRALSD
jgi:phospholipid transport system substrate-binding protein